MQSRSIIPELLTQLPGSVQWPREGILLLMEFKELLKTEEAIVNCIDERLVPGCTLDFDRGEWDGESSPSPGLEACNLGARQNPFLKALTHNCCEHITLTSQDPPKETRTTKSECNRMDLWMCTASAAITT